jgi:hypothetical protein
MPFELIWEPRGVCRRYFGAVTVAERQRSFDLICGDPRFDALRYTITDYREVVDYEISEEATAEIAALHVGPLLTNPNIVMAAVVTDERIIAAIRHFMSLDFTPQPYEIFADEAAARAWIAQMHATVPTRPRNT